MIRASGLSRLFAPFLGNAALHAGACQARGDGAGRACAGDDDGGHWSLVILKTRKVGLPICNNAIGANVHNDVIATPSIGGRHH